MKHEIPISATFTLFKYFNVTPSVSYTERWYTRKVMKDWDPNIGTSGREVETDTIYGFHRVYNYSASLGVNTKIYGMYKPLFMKKKEIQIRHVITPFLSVSVQLLTLVLPAMVTMILILNPMLMEHKIRSLILHMPDKCSECLDKENLEIFHSRYPITWK